MAVGSRGTILLSNDGITWEPGFSGTLDYITSVAYVKNIFLAVTKTGVIMTPGSNCGPTLWIDSGLSGNQGDVFLFTGSDYTPYGPVTRYLIFPDGNESTLPLIYSDSKGDISWSFSSSCSDLPGFYEYWAIDNQTGKSSNRLGLRLYSGPGCLQSTLLIDGGTSSTRQQGETFSFTGSSYLPNGTVTRHIRLPDGSEDMLQLAVDSNGNISWIFTSSCSNALGTYAVWVVDDVTGMTSNTVTEIITANPSCSNTQPLALITMTAQGQTVYENQTLIYRFLRGRL